MLRGRRCRGALRSSYVPPKSAAHDPSAATETRVQEIEERELKRPRSRHLEAIDSQGAAGPPDGTGVVSEAAQVLVACSRGVDVHAATRLEIAEHRWVTEPELLLGRIEDPKHDDVVPARPQVAQVGLDGYFEVVWASAYAGCNKPHPGIFHQALAQMNVPPERALYVGDSYWHDVVGARNAGLDVVLVDREGTAEAEDYPVIGDLSGVLELVAG